jgi:LytS/YehU family sensor histidine kinase
MHKFWRVEMFQKLQFAQEKTQAELALLKAQLHPHFLFNTLNNLYTLILRESDRAPDMLRRLTGILNYVLNECHADQVPLEREIAFCRDYIDLEKERYGDRLDIDVMFSGDLENKFITPMLFQPFIENAFKHGASEQVGQVWIDIRLTALDNQLEFIVTNSAAPADRAPASGGIGIANIHRRLQLLYPDRYRFVREQQEGMYSIALTIELPTRPKVRSIVRPSSPSSIANARLQFHLEKK